MNIHSEEAKECFKGHKIAEGFSPTSSVNLTGLLKSYLNHRKTRPSLTSFLQKKMRNLNASLAKFIEQKHLEEKETWTEKHGRRGIELN